MEPGSATFQLSWEARGGESATLSGPAGTDTAQLSGTALHCAQDGSTFTLTVVGPGGSASRTVTADVPDPVQ